MSVETPALKPAHNSRRSVGSACSWRFLVLPSRSTATRPEATVARFDQPHRLEVPHILNWSEQIVAPKIPGLDLGGAIDCGFDFSPRDVREQAVWSSANTEINAPQLSPTAPVSFPGTHLQLRAMLAEAAHDIRAPIGVARQILNRLSSLARNAGKLSSTDIGLIDSASDRLEQATSWVDGILLPNRLTKAYEVTLRQRFYPHQVLSLIRPNVQDLADRRNVQIRWEGWERSLPRLYLDANQLGRVLQNLIVNAIEASPEEAVLSIRVAWQTNVTQRLVIAIEDEGEGLSEPILRYINSTDASVPPAEVGIGLQTVKRLMRSCGSLSAQIVPRGGTLFRLTLPVDNRLSIVRGWLLQNAQPAQRLSPTSVRTIGLHLIRSSGLDAYRVDRLLQEQATPGDLVYRVSDDRWLWLTMQGESSKSRAVGAIGQLIDQEGVANGRIHSQLMIEWPHVDFCELLSATDQRHLLPQLSKSIARKFDELAGNRIPPIDQLKTSFRSAKPAGGSGRERSDRNQRMLRVDTPRSSPELTRRFPGGTFGNINLLNTDPDVFSRVSLSWEESDASD